MHRAHCAPWSAAGPQRVSCSPPAPASLPLPGPSEAVPRRASPCRQPKPLPTSARALGGPLFRDHKAALILCSAPSHVTRGAGRALRRPAQPFAAAGVSAPRPLFPPASHRWQGAPQVARPPGSPQWPGGRAGSSSSLARLGSAPRPAGQRPGPGRGAAGAWSPRGAQIFGCGVEEKGFVRPQLSLCKYLASTPSGEGLPRQGVSRDCFPFARGFPHFQEGPEDHRCLLKSVRTDCQPLGQAARRTGRWESSFNRW